MNNENDSAVEDGCDTPRYWPILTSVAHADKRARTLSAFVELSFLAGRDGDATDDWRADMLGALDKAFPGIRPDRRAALEELLTAAFYAGDGHATIKNAARPERAARFAQARATLHELDCEWAGDRHHSVHEREAGSTAYYLARKLPIGSDEAAACTIDALRAAGFELHFLAVEKVIEAACRGVEEREGWEAAQREYRESEDSLLDSILSGEPVA